MHYDNSNPESVIDAEFTDTAIVVSNKDADLALTPVFDLETAQKRLVELQKFVKFYLVEGEDYGTIPGTAKPTLYKPGADKLCDIYGLADKYRTVSQIEDWDKNLFSYHIECTLVSKRNEKLAATGLGSCNSYEGKYRWRETQRVCPECGKTSIIRGKEEFGGGWLCWKKKDGCGHKFAKGDKSIEGQEVGRVENDDIPTLVNTILKMAKKRAKVDAVLSATRSSGLFTQDVEDWVAVEQHEEGSREAQKEVAERKTKELQKRVEDQKNAKNGNPATGLDPAKVIFVLQYPKDPTGDHLISGPGLELVGAKRVSPENPNHRLIAGKDWLKFHDVCRNKGVVVKDVANPSADA
jgi:predicted RNA-binding Zn-ribbon protein involved in translation (DUF1610 family)